MFKRHKLKKIFGIINLLNTIYFGLLDGYNRTDFQVGKETTYFTEPLDAEGYVDYEKAINEYMSRGVDPKN